MISTSYKYGDFRMTKRIYETMRRYEIPADNKIQLRYFMHQRIALKQDKKKPGAGFGGSSMMTGNTSMH